MKITDRDRNKKRKQTILSLGHASDLILTFQPWLEIFKNWNVQIIKIERLKWENLTMEEASAFFGKSP